MDSGSLKGYIPLETKRGYLEIPCRIEYKVYNGDEMDLIAVTVGDNFIVPKLSESQLNCIKEQCWVHHDDRADRKSALACDYYEGLKEA